MRKHALILAFAALPATLWLAAAPARAQWTNDPWNGMVSVCNAPEDQSNLRICALAGNRTFIAWMDERGPADYSIYYQILDAFGNATREPNGEPVIDANWFIGWGTCKSSIVPDGQGGCIAVFEDDRNGTWDIYGQRFDSLGNRLWGAQGLPLVPWPGTWDTMPKDLNSDSLGNFFLSWATGINGNCDIYIQKFTAEGLRLWGECGVPVCTEMAIQDLQQSVPDGQGGILDVWMDERSGWEEYKLYGQHLDADGNPLWQPNGLRLRNTQGAAMWVQDIAEGLPDGHGGGYWFFKTPGGLNNLQGIHLTGQGRTTWWLNLYYNWAYTVFAVCSQPESGGIWISDWECVTLPNVYTYNVHRIDPATGTLPFGRFGLPYGGQAMAPVGGGVMTFRLAWSYTAPHPGTRLTAMRVDSSGRLIWHSEVVLSHIVADIPYSPYNPLGAVTMQNGDAVVAFHDWRDTTNLQNISAQRVQSNGSLGNPPTPVTSQEGELIGGISGTMLSFVLPAAGEVRIEIFDLLGRLVVREELGYQAAGAHRTRLENSGLASGIYLLRLNTPVGCHIIKMVVFH